MSLMDILDDFVLGPLNLIDRFQGLTKGIIYRDLGYRFAIPRIDKGGRFTLNEIEDLLKRYGVDVYGRTHDSQNMYFLVKRRQARWAEYLMLHAGVELRNPIFDQRNAGYAASHATGWMPKPWAESSSPNMELSDIDTISKHAKQHHPQNGFGKVLEWIDRL